MRKELHETKEKLEDKVDSTVINQIKFTISSINDKIIELEKNLEKISRKEEEDTGIINGNVN